MELIWILALAVTHLLQDAGRAPDRATPAPALRVTSFNIRYGTAKDGENAWDKRKDLVLRTIRKLDPDLMGVQEALAFQVDELRDALPGYEVLGVGRDDGKRAGEFTAIYFKKDRFEQLAAGHFWLSETPEQPGSRGWDAALPRLASWVRLRDRQTGGPLLFVNTHFDHVGRQARLESARLLRSQIEKLHEGAPVVVAGDFNATEDDEPYAALMGEGGAPLRLIDSYRAVHPQRSPDEATFNGFTGKRAGSRIDWVLHSDHFKTTSAEIMYDSEAGRYPSDHFPLSAVLQYGLKRD